MNRHLVLGGARSGKSGYAQGFAERTNLPVTLIVTAEIWDDEMAERVAKHRADRPAHWEVLEAPYDLPDAIAAAAQAGRFVLVDCLTLWLSNILCTRETELEACCTELIRNIRNAQGELVLVSNEVGWSIVPENALARRFRDEQGRLNQRIAQVCEQVTLVAAGLPLSLKGAQS